MNITHKILDEKLILIKDNKEIAYISFKINNGVLVLHQTFVHPLHRGNNYAHLMFQYLHNFLINNKLKVEILCEHALKWFVENTNMIQSLL